MLLSTLERRSNKRRPKYCGIRITAASEVHYTDKEGTHGLLYLDELKQQEENFLQTFLIILNFWN